MTCAFTDAMNRSEFRFEVGNCIKERTRLLQRKLDAVTNGKKHSLRFLNEHASQIGSLTHQVEHDAFEMIRNACDMYGASLERLSEDAYSQVDFRLDNTVKIQDKVGILHRNVQIRKAGGHPLNPDEIDVLQITDLQYKLCYIIPMRILAKDGTVVSQFTERELMRYNIYISRKWLNTLLKFDLTNTADIKSYIETCHDAHLVPPLSNKNFYDDILQRNAAMFGPRHKFQNVGANKAQVLT